MCLTSKQTKNNIHPCILTFDNIKLFLFLRVEARLLREVWVVKTNCPMSMSSFPAIIPERWKQSKYIPQVSFLVLLPFSSCRVEKEVMDMPDIWKIKLKSYIASPFIPTFKKLWEELESQRKPLLSLAILWLM